MAVVREHDAEPDQDEQRVAREHSRLKHADRMAERTGELADEIDKNIDNPLVPPHGNPGKGAGQPARAVDTEAVDHFCVEQAEGGAQILYAIDEESVVEFIDVILVNQKSVEARPGSGNLRVKLWMLKIELVRQPEAQDGDANRREHK